MRKNSVSAYACYNQNREVRMRSSSGAIFSLLAEQILSENGIVYGVSMAEDCYSAEFLRVETREKLSYLRGSKYMQAKVGDTFRSVRDDLLLGTKVLFTGTGCQINGLKGYLDKNYENLICVDVICHGAPSPALWKKYAEYQEKRSGGKLRQVNFRCKDDGWMDFGMKEVLADIAQGKAKWLYISKDEDPYMQMFLRDYCLRPSCYNCIAKQIKMADLTIADFWGINDVAPEMNDGNGTSLVLIRTGKGMRVFETISDKLKLKEVAYEDGVRCNPAEYRSCCRPLQRNTFFKDMEVMRFEELEKQYASPIKVTLKTKVKRKIKNTIKLALRIGGGREYK